MASSSDGKTERRRPKRKAPRQPETIEIMSDSEEEAENIEEFNGEVSVSFLEGCVRFPVFDCSSNNPFAFVGNFLV